ncbi:cold-shock protein [Domibacillus mangrovi]|uniref:Cold-shock protein n=1 Tax=Domibacillus mangrovi TaxID=1714354 RepID=A0A1Q5P530_9BACI|nr:cold-shock protein [Domibacillus mangrovi]OKL37334.1 hypothetical protein BLL40_07100 [Domibacillus mangrovi]
MSYYSKNRAEPLPNVDIETWECTKDDCNGWMRKNFSEDDSPSCPFCGSDMETGNRLTNSLQNNTFRKSAEAEQNEQKKA